MERVKYKEFLNDLLENGEVIKDSCFKDYFGGSEGYYQLAANSDDVNLIGDRLSAGAGDIIKFNGAIYSITHFIVSDSPFNVSGFTGDVSFSDDIIDSLIHDIKLLQMSVSSFMGMGVDVAGGYQHEFPIKPYEAARRIFECWYAKTISYIEEHLAYNLMADSHILFDKNGGDNFWSKVKGYGRFYNQFKDFDSLSKLPRLLDFNALLSYVAGEFNEDEINRRALEDAAEELTREYINKKSHKAFDKYKLRYSSWHSDRFDPSHYEKWTDALGVCCNEQGKSDFYNSFITEFTDAQISCGGDAVKCGNVLVRNYKEHITLSMPKEISMVIGVFINKFASEYLQDLAS